MRKKKHFPGINAAESKRKFIRWISGLIKGWAGGDSCVVKGLNGRIQPQLFHHIKGSEMDAIEGDISSMSDWFLQCKAGISLMHTLLHGCFCPL